MSWTVEALDGYTYIFFQKNLKTIALPYHMNRNNFAYLYNTFSKNHTISYLVFRAPCYPDNWSNEQTLHLSRNPTLLYYCHRLNFDPQLSKSPFSSLKFASRLIYVPRPMWQSPLVATTSSQLWSLFVLNWLFCPYLVLPNQIRTDLFLARP
jgi:hypothetical protein